MSALRSHLERIDRSQFLGVEIWKSLLNAIDRTSQMSTSDINKMDDLRLLARYVLFLLNQTFDDSGGLLCHPDFCALMVEAYLHKARSGESIPPKTISEIVDLMINYKHFPLDVLSNAIATIRYIVENQKRIKRDLPIEVVIRVIEDAIKSVKTVGVDIRLKEAYLRLLGVMLPDYPNLVICEPLFQGLMNCLTDKKLVSSSCTVLSVWISALRSPHLFQLDAGIDQEFNRFFEHILNLLETDLSIKKKISLVNLLGRAAEKGFVFSDDHINSFISNALLSQNLALQQSCSRTMAAVLRFQSRMRWSQDFFDLLIQVCQSSDKHLLIDNFSLLCHYIKLLEAPLAEPQMNQLASLLSEEKSVQFVCEVFYNMVEKSWKINENCCELLANLTLDDLSQAQIAAAGVLEAAAKQQEFSDRVMGRVIQGLSSDREEVVLSCVLILNKKNIKKIANNAETLAKKSLESLMMIVAKNYYPSNIRVKVFSILIYFSEHTSLSFPFSLLELLLDRLYDQNEEVRVLAIRVLSLQVPHLRLSISIRNSFMREIMDSVVPCLQDEKQKEDAIRVIAQMVNFGYNELSLDDLNDIAMCLYNECDIETPKIVFGILEKYQSQLQTVSKEIFEIQGVVLSFRKGTHDLKLKSIESLISFVELRYRMPASVFRSLTEWIDRFSHSTDFKQELLRSICQFCEVVIYHEPSLPPTLLQAFSRLERKELSYENQSRLSLLIVQCLRKNNSVDPFAFFLVEEGFLTDLDDRELSLYLDALEIIVKQRPVVQRKTLEKLWTLLSKKIDIQIVAQILTKIFSADTFHELQSPNHLDQLLHLIEASSSTDIRQTLTALMRSLNRLIQLKENQLQLIYGSICSTEDLEEQYDLCQILKLQLSRPAHFSDEYSKIITFKETEREILEKCKKLSDPLGFQEIIRSIRDLTTYIESTALQEFPLALFDSLMFAPNRLCEDEETQTPFIFKRPPLSSKFFLAIEHLLKTFQAVPLDDFHDLLKMIDDYQSLPDGVIQSLLGLPDEHLMNFFDILDSRIEKKNDLNDEILIKLRAILIESTNWDCRHRTYDLLKRFFQSISYRSLPDESPNLSDSWHEYSQSEDGLQESRRASFLHEELRSLVDVEAIHEEFKDIRCIETHIMNGGELSFGNAEFLIGYFIIGEHRQKILQIFDAVKFKLPKTTCQLIFAFYKDHFFSNGFFFSSRYHSFYVSFISQVLTDNKVSLVEGIECFRLLYDRVLNSRKMTIHEFDMLNFLAKYHNIQLNQELITKLVDFYCLINDSERRNKATCLILKNLIRLPIWSDMLLRALTRLTTKLEGIKIVEGETPISSFQLSGFLSSLKGSFTTIMDRFFWQSSEFPVDPVKEAPLLLDLLAFVVESDKSVHKFDRFNQQGKLAPFLTEGDLLERLIEMSADEDLSLEEKNHSLPSLIHVKASYSDSQYRQILRVLLFKQNEDRKSISQIDEIISIFCAGRSQSLELLQEDLATAKEIFFEKLFASFPSFKLTSLEKRQELFRYYERLKWCPIKATEFFSNVPVDAAFDELSTFLRLVDDFSVGQDVIQANLFPGMSLCSLTSKLMVALLAERLKRLPRLVSGEIGFIDDQTRSSEHLRKSVFSALALCQQGWCFKRLMDWLTSINQNTHEEVQEPLDIRYTSEILSLASNYQQQIGENRFYELVNTQLDEGKILFSEMLHAYVLNHHLISNQKVKDLSTIIEEIKSSLINQNDPKLMQQSVIDQMTSSLALAEQLYWSPVTEQRVSGDLVSPLPVNEWSKEDIKTWACEIKHMADLVLESSSSLDSLDNFEESILAECLAVFKRASILLFGYPPRVVQFVAILVLRNRTDPGILAQISTGEGKSLIIAMFAILKALQRRKIDVMTSSSELAQRDVKDLRHFYELFSLRIASNEDHQYESGMKKCYGKDIDVVYGDSSHFQWDILRHEYGGLETKGDRGFDLVIIDEVDNVLIEGNDNLTMLASPMPCMQELIPLMIGLWIEFMHLIELKDSLKEAKSMEVKAFSQVESSEDSVESEEVDSSEEIDDGAFFRSSENLKDHPFYQIDVTDLEAVKEVIQRELIAYIHKVLEDAEGGIQIPKHLKRFVMSQGKYWIQSAWLAYYQYKNGREYRIETNLEGVECIAPVDFANTGTTQLGTSWGEGLQQFLQLKHSLTVEPLTLVTNYSSTYSYVNRYRYRMGITGTLGSSALQDLLKKIYRFDSVAIPTFLPKNRLSLNPELLHNHELWKEAIVLNAIRDANLGRVVLIICETIELAEQLHLLLVHRYAKPGLFLYSDDKNESKQFLQKEQGPGTIIVATNLAGRGTDIQISKEVIKKGGLHVCLTFLPTDKRVRKQAFGRTSRRGEPGTVQLVLDLQAILEQFPFCNIEALAREPKRVKYLSDPEECDKLENIKAVVLPNIEHQERLFKGYLGLLEEIKKIDEAKHSVAVVDQIKMQMDADRIYFKELCEAKRGALEERWGRWLRDALSQGNKERSEHQFLMFKEQMLKAYQQETIIDNPMYYVRLGNELLNRASRYHHYFSKNTFYEKAIESYEKAIAMDKTFSFIAYYHRAYALLELKRDGYKKILKEDFIKMQQALIEGPLRQHQAIYLLLSQYRSSSLAFGKDFVNSQFQQQLQVYYLLLDSAKGAVRQVEESQKLITIDSDIRCFSQTCSKKFTRRGAIRRLNSPAPSTVQPKFRLTFHHLKTHMDITETSELEETIQKLPSKIPITISFDGDKLYSTSGQKYHLRALLPLFQKKIRRDERSMDPSSETQSSAAESELSSKDSGSHQAPIITLTDRGADLVAKSTKVVNRAASKLSKVMKSGKNAVLEQIDHFNEGSSLQKELEAIPATLTIRDISLKGIKEMLEKFASPFKSAKRGTTTSGNTKKIVLEGDKTSILRESIFGIGPLTLTTELFEFLKTKSPHLNVSVWFPQLDHQTKETHANEPKSVTLSDLNIDNSEGEISILECSYDELQEVLEFLCNQSSFRSLQFVLHRLTQSTASRWIKLVNAFASKGGEGQSLDWARPDDRHEKKGSSPSISLSFVELDHQQAINVARKTINEHNNATLSISGLDANNAKKIIQTAECKERDFSIFHHPFKAELEKICPHPSFALRQQLNGMLYLYDINEKNPLPIKGMALLTSLSLLQITGGLVITTFSGGAGAALGSSLVSEGIGDVARLFTAVSSREFDASTFMLEKSLSVAMTLATCGSGGVEAVKKTSRKIKKIGNYLMEHGDEMIQVGLKVGNKFVRTTQTVGLDLVKNRAMRVVQSSLKHGVDSSLTMASGSFLKGVEPSLVQNMNRAIQDMFNKDHWQRTLNKMLAVDAFTNTQEEFTIALSAISKLISTAKFNMLDINEFNKKIFVQFEKPFNDFLSERYVYLKNIERILDKRSIGLTFQEVEVGCAWLRGEGIIDSNGEVDLIAIRSYLRLSETSPTKDQLYDADNYNLALFSFEHPRPILQACLTYAQFLRDDYLLKKRELIDKITSDFSKELFRNLKTAIDLTKEVLSKSAGKVIDYSTEAVSKRMSQNRRNPKGGKRRHRRRHDRPESQKSSEPSKQLPSTNPEPHPGEPTSSIVGTVQGAPVGFNPVIREGANGSVQPGRVGFDLGLSYGEDGTVQTGAVSFNLGLSYGEDGTAQTGAVGFNLGVSTEGATGTPGTLLQSVNYSPFSPEFIDKLNALPPDARMEDWTATHVPGVYFSNDKKDFVFSEAAFNKNAPEGSTRSAFERRTNSKMKADHSGDGNASTSSPIPQLKGVRLPGTGNGSPTSSSMNQRRDRNYGSRRPKGGRYRNRETRSPSMMDSLSDCMKISGDFAIRFVKEFFLNQYDQASRAKEAIEKNLLDETAISSGQKIAELYRRLMSEQIKVLRSLTGLILIERSAMVHFNEEERKRLDQDIMGTYWLCFEAYQRGEDPLIPDLRQIATEIKETRIQVYVRTLEEGWAKYDDLKNKEMQAISGYLSQIRPHEILSNMRELIERKNAVGFFCGRQESSHQMMVQEIILKQVGEVVESINQLGSISATSRARIECMTLKMVKECLLVETNLQEEILHMKDKHQTLVANVVSEQTAVAKIVTEAYGTFLNDIFQATQIEDREARLKTIQEIKVAYADYLAVLDSRVEGRIHVMKSNSVDSLFFTESTKQAALVITQVLQIAEEITGKDPTEIETLNTKIFSDVQSRLMEGSKICAVGHSPEIGTNTSDAQLMSNPSVATSSFGEYPPSGSTSSRFLGDSIIFTFNGSHYQRRFNTCGDGACALHSLLGTRARVASRDCIQYIWNPAELDVNQEGDAIQRIAKQTFIDTLRPVFDCEEHPLHRDLMYSVRLALQETTEFKEWDRQHELNWRKIQERLNSQLTREFYLANKEKLDPIFALTPREFALLQIRVTEGTEDLSEILANCIDPNIDDLKRAGINHPNWIQILQEKENKQMAESTREEGVLEFLKSHFNLYETLVLRSNYYLDFEELTLAAHLFKPRAQVIVFSDEVAPPRIINPQATEEVISIEHTMAYFLDGKHFNRIEVE
jgi:tetratricopeptide (TPR) repeat protein